MSEPKTYSIVEVTGQKPWEGKFGPMVDYYLTLRNEAGAQRNQVQLAQKASTPAPSPGQSLELTVEADGQGRLKAKKVQPLGRPQGLGGPRPRDPKESAQIMRCHAQKVAADLLMAQHPTGLPVGLDVGRTIRDYADLLCNDVKYFLQQEGQS